MRGVSYSLAALVLCEPVVSLLSTTGSTVELNSIDYFLPPQPVATINLGKFSSNGTIVPMMVVESGSDVSATIQSYDTKDDVFQKAFAEVIYVKSTSTKINLGGSTDYTVVSGDANIPIGPYFVNPMSGAVYQAYRLYSDSQGAFTETAIESGSGVFSVLPANLPGQNLAIAVPSRLYYTKTSDKPLAGVRLGVKDIYDVAGLKTSNGNRAWYKFYPPATANAVAIQRLIDAGAIVIGKMKTSQFANGETATADWVDYHEPFNPRGDGYQDTSSSSSGPGAGAGAYPWLDLTIGSDTGGSIRGPSESQGLFGNRPSHGLVPLTGVMPLSPALDTAGFLTRDPYLWLNASQVLYGGLKTYTQFPKQILTVGFPTGHTDPDFDSFQADRIILKFLKQLKGFLKASVTPFDFGSAFNATGPQNNRDLTQLLNITYPTLISKQQTPLVRDPFYKDYAAKYNGRRPFIDPVPLVRWAFGDSLPPTATGDALNNKTIFMNWFNSKVLIPSPSSATCSDKILLYVGSDGGTAYRNRWQDLSPPRPPAGFSVGRVSPFSEAPDFVVPIGQAKYNSTVTNHVEVLPVTIDFMVAKGCDGMLFTLIQKLVEAGIATTPVAGRTLENGGVILAKRTADLQ